jgi:uridine phosphorylase
LRSLFDPSSPALKAPDIVLAITGKKPEELQLPRRAIITFNIGDAKIFLGIKNQKPIKGWTPFRNLFLINDSETIVTRCYFGGPNIAALVEELSAFGVREFILWGYCGGISDDIEIGDLLIAEGALRQDGVSYHYLDNTDDYVFTDWFPKWHEKAALSGIRPAVIWSCDAIYRETKNKISSFKKMGIHGVEMETASFYAVCKAKKLRGITFLVVSDCFKQHKWKPGFFDEAFREGARKMGNFLMNEALLRRNTGSKNQA